MNEFWGYIESRDLGKKYFVADNRDVTDVICPIDRTPLVNINGYDFSTYKCFACDASYGYMPNEEKLKNIARNYVLSQAKQLTGLKNEIAKLEKIIGAAIKNGLISDERKS